MNIETFKEASVLSPNQVTAFNAECREIIEFLREHPEIKTKAQLFRDSKFTYGRFNRKRAKYHEKPYTQELVKKIDEILEARLLEQGFTARNPAFIIFLLKNFYGYQDKREVEQETTHVFKVSRGAVIDVLPSKGKKIRLKAKT